MLHRPSGPNVRGCTALLLIVPVCLDIHAPQNDIFDLPRAYTPFNQRLCNILFAFSAKELEDIVVEEWRIPLPVLYSTRVSFRNPVIVTEAHLAYTQIKQSKPFSWVRNQEAQGWYASPFIPRGVLAVFEHYEGRQEDSARNDRFDRDITLAIPVWRERWKHGVCQSNLRWPMVGE